jgi:hypothetical protein
MPQIGYRRWPLDERDNVGGSASARVSILQAMDTAAESGRISVGVSLDIGGLFARPWYGDLMRAARTLAPERPEVAVAMAQMSVEAYVELAWRRCCGNTARARPRYRPKWTCCPGSTFAGKKHGIVGANSPVTPFNRLLRGPRTSKPSSCETSSSIAGSGRIRKTRPTRSSAAPS